MAFTPIGEPPRVDTDEVVRWEGVLPMFASRRQDGNGLEIGHGLKIGHGAVRPEPPPA